jgi:Guanosine polyphosphate pyrophosphohydrolases/synthetases
MLERELGKNGFEALLKSAPMQATAERCNYHSVEDLLAALGYGEITLNLTLNRLREAVKGQQTIARASEGINDAQVIPLLPSVSKPTPVQPSSKSPIIGVEGLLYHMAGCCTPVPGEAIIGVVTRGRGISIHRQGCPNAEQVPGDRLVPVNWNSHEQESGRPQTYPVDIQIEVIDRVGVLKDILSRLTDNNINVRNAQVKTYPDQTATIDLGIDIRDHEQLERTFTQIKKLSDVLNLRRLSQLEE